MTPAAGRRAPRARPTLVDVKPQARTMARAAGRGLLQVLIGPDPAPAWRSKGARNAAITAAVLGGVLLVAAALGGTLLIARSLGDHPSAQDFQRPTGLLVVLFTLAACLPLAVRYPLLAWRITYLVVLLGPLLPGENGLDPGSVAILLITFVIAGLRRPRAVLWWMQALTLVPVWLWTGPDWVKPAEVSLLFLGAGALTEGAAAWWRARQALADQTRLAEAERARRAVLEERAKIAREMHDVVAHHMSLIVVQAQTAQYRLGAGTVSEPVAKEFAALGGAARDALTEMRRLLGVLRSDAPAEHAPQPRLADVPELAEAARKAGVEASLTMPPDPDAVPAGVGVAAYRIVQEALSNAGRHAPGAAISIAVEVEPAVVRLCVLNGPATGQPRDQGTGHGLAGMRERAALLGGWLKAGAEPGGGFAVRAELPMEGPAS
jgi:signal transduction histidine kinase